MSSQQGYQNLGSGGGLHASLMHAKCLRPLAVGRVETPLLGQHLNSTYVLHPRPFQLRRFFRLTEGTLVKIIHDELQTS